MLDPSPPLPPFADRLLRWFDREGRHDLPWQQDRTLYRVWVSEVMLQQTQVATAIPYFERFVRRFPDVATLAGAAEDEVLHLWSGLGYYARARNLLRAARQVVTDHGAEVPAVRDALESLPGIGKSTAGAILAQALDRREPILDGNVKRVLTRWGGIDGYPADAAVSARLWRLSDRLTPGHRARDYTQAIMDLGATRCTRHKPRCTECPVAEDCRARREGRQAALPTRKPARQRPTRTVHWLVVCADARVWLVRRPSSGLWGGLYGFPEAEDEDGVRRHAEGRYPGSARRLEAQETFRHTFSHFDLLVHPWLLRAAPHVEPSGETWYNVIRPPNLGLAAPVAGLLERIHDRLIQSGGEGER